MSNYARTVKGRTGVHPNTRCVVCKITAAKFSRGEPVDTGINHPEYCRTLSFYEQRYGSKKYLCAKCHRESELKSLFEAMDRRDILKKKGLK